MKHLVLLLCLPLLIHAQETPKVVGGEPVDIKDYPWQVALTSSPNGSGFCGGSIIGDSWVLTAAHCVNGDSPNSVYVRVGSSNAFASGGTSYSLNNIIVHPSYSGNSYDFALLEIDGEFNYNENVQKIDLVTAADIAAGVQDPGVIATITGWGTTSSGGSLSSTLMMVEAPIVSNDVACGASTDENGNSGDYDCSSLDESMICAGDLVDGGEDACQGDSGGPLAVRNSDNTKWLLIGATSWGYGCAYVDYPGVWSKVSYVLNWINSNTDANEDDDNSCICIEIYEPVCGANGITYSNSCFADCDGVTYTEGYCIDVIYGCMDESAFNYNVDANEDDGSCISVVNGCTDNGLEVSGTGVVNDINGDGLPATNYNPLANTDDGSCISQPELLDCQGEDYSGYEDWLGDGYCDDGTWGIHFDCEQFDYDYGDCGDITQLIEGCTDEAADNYSPNATEDDGSCQYSNNDCVGQYDAGFYDAQSIPITLNQGWNMIGYTRHVPQDVAATLESISEHIVIAKDGAGNAYLPDWGFNGIGDFTPGLGYQIKITQEFQNYVLPDIGELRLILTPSTPDWANDLPIYTHPNDVRTLIRVVNELGQLVNPSNVFDGTVLFYIYNDGTVEKHINQNNR